MLSSSSRSQPLSPHFTPFHLSAALQPSRKMLRARLHPPARGAAPGGGQGLPGGVRGCLGVRVFPPTGGCAASSFPIPGAAGAVRPPGGGKGRSGGKGAAATGAGAGAGAGCPGAAPHGRAPPGPGEAGMRRKGECTPGMWAAEGGRPGAGGYGAQRGEPREHPQVPPCLARRCPAAPGAAPRDHGSVAGGGAGCGEPW